MTVIIIFMRKDEVLLRYEKRLDRKEDFQQADEEARQQFRDRFPGVSLFDGITVLYDKAD